MSKPPLNLDNVEIPRGEKRPLVTAPAQKNRVNFSTRLDVEVQERLRRWAFETRGERQDAVEKALDEWLKTRGF